MSENSTARRDLVWDAVLVSLSQNPSSIKFRDVEFNLERDVSDRTIQRTMSAMRELGWLRKDKESGHYWYPGRKAVKYLQYDTDTVDRIEHHLKEQPEQDEQRSVDEYIDDVDEPAEPRGQEQIDDFVDDVDLPGSGQTEQERREALRDVLFYIREHGEASPAQIQEALYDTHIAGYHSDHSWWKNCIYPGLSESDLVETGGEGSRTWRWVGNS